MQPVMRAEPRTLGHIVKYWDYTVFSLIYFCCETDWRTAERGIVEYDVCWQYEYEYEYEGWCEAGVSRWGDSLILDIECLKCSHCRVLCYASAIAHQRGRGPSFTSILDAKIKVPQSRRRPILGPSPCWKRLLVLSHLTHYWNTMLNSK